MKSVYINTLRPAEINVPNSVQSVVLLDRTKHQQQTIGVIEGILSGEGINEDKDGVMAVFGALQNNLRNSPRYEVKLASERLAGNNLMGNFPDPLRWADINRLTNKYNTDALLAVELFDTNFIVTNGKRKKTRKVKKEDGKEIEEEFTEYYAEGVGTARVGIRLYDPQQKTIIDQQIYTENRSWEATGTNVRDALASLVQKSQATRYLGSAIGASYAGKIAPLPISISRSYYAKPKKNPYIRKGARQAEVDQWEAAINTWKAGIINTDDSKEKGRMAYNIALAHEVLGDLYTAQEWAGKAYIDFGEKKAKSYAEQLSQRMHNERLLDEQMQLPNAKTDEGTKDLQPTKKRIELKIDNN